MLSLLLWLRARLSSLFSCALTTTTTTTNKQTKQTTEAEEAAAATIQRARDSTFSLICFLLRLGDAARTLLCPLLLW
jgi:hypothetical protein